MPTSSKAKIMNTRNAMRISFILWRFGVCVWILYFVLDGTFWPFNFHVNLHELLLCYFFGLGVCLVFK